MTAIHRMADPEGDAAIILVRSIAANLTEKPTTASQIQELQHYLETDEVIEDAEAPNGFGIQVRIRQPLLASLAGLRQIAGG
jgi:hypothetical protein